MGPRRSDVLGDGALTGPLTLSSVREYRAPTRHVGKLRPNSRDRVVLRSLEHVPRRAAENWTYHRPRMGANSEAAINCAQLELLNLNHEVTHRTGFSGHWDHTDSRPAAWEAAVWRAESSCGDGCPSATRATCFSEACGSGADRPSLPDVARDEEECVTSILPALG